MVPVNSVSHLSTLHGTKWKTVIKDVRTRATKFLELEQEVLVMTLLWNIYRIIVIYSVNLDKNMKMENVRRNVLTNVRRNVLIPVHVTL